jgi:mono/diheme cytochrome c family protein
VAASVIGVGVIAFAWANDWTRGLRDAADLRDPAPVTETSSVRGRTLYSERCVPCHGERGRGDGPAAVGLQPPPADLVLHVPQHSDGELFYMITRGVPNTAMPEWRNVLTERERWDLVHYLRVLASGSP